METKVMSVRLPETLLEKLKEKAQEEKITISEFIIYHLLKVLKNEEDSVEENKNLKVALAFFDCLYKQIYKILSCADDTVDLITYFKKRLRGSRRVGEINFLLKTNEVTFETQAGTLTVPNHSLSSPEEIKKELIELHESWRALLEKNKVEKEEEKIKSFLEMF